MKKNAPQHRFPPIFSLRLLSWRKGLIGLSLLALGAGGEAQAGISTVISGSTNLSAATSYNPNGAPTATTDVLFASGSTYLASTFGSTGVSGTLNLNSLNDLASGSLAITELTTSTTALNFSGTGGNTAGGDAGDIIYVSAGTMTVTTAGTRVISLNLSGTGGNIDIGAGAVFSTNAVISGTSFNKTGAGTLILTNNNPTYTGTATVTSGTIQLGTGVGSSGAFNGKVVDNGTIVITHTINYNSVTSGTGGIIITGGTTTFNNTLSTSGTNTYSGDTIVMAGATVISGNSGGNGYISQFSALTDNGTFAFDRSGSTNYANTISGTGSLVFQNTGASSGIYNLSGTNTFSGTTFIVSTATTSPTLSIGAGGTTGSLDFTAGIVLAGGTVAFNRSDTYSYLGGAVSGSGALAQIGAGRTILSGTNTYTGVTSSTNGILEFSNTAALPDFSKVSVTTGAALAVNTTNWTAANVTSLLSSGTFSTNSALGLDAASGTFTYGSDIGATNHGGIGLGLNKFGAGTVVLTATNTYTGTTTIGAGTLQVGDGSSGATLGTGNVADNGALVFNTLNTGTTLGAISGSGSVLQMGAGTMVLTGSNTYTGGTTITNGTLQIGATVATGTGSVTGDILDNGVLAISRTGTYTYSNIISGAGRVNLLASGTVVYTGNNTYTGTTNIGAGALRIGAGGTTGAIASTAIVDNGALAFNHSDGYAYGGAISGSGSVSQVGTGTTTLSGATSYTGLTTVSGGALEVGGTLANNSGVSVAANTALIVSASTANNSTTWTSGAVTSLLSSGTFATNSALGLDVASGGTFTFGSNLGTTNGAGAGLGLTKLGAGTVVLSATANTYTGTTTISAGTLQIGDGTTGGLTASNVVNNGALVLATGATPTTMAGKISGTGTTLVQGGSVTFNGANTSTGGMTVTSGSVGIGIASGLGVGTLTINSGTVNVNGIQSTKIGGLNGDSNSLLTNVSGGTVNLSIDAFSSSGTNVYAGRITSGGSAINMSFGAVGATYTQLLTGSSQWSNATTIISGTVLLGNSSAVGTSRVTFGGSAGSNDDHTLLAVGGTSGFNFAGSTMTVSGSTSDNPNTGVTTLGGLNTSGTDTWGGAIQLGTSSTNSTGSLTNAFHMTSATGGTQVYTGSIFSGTNTGGSENATVSIDGGGATVFSGSNTYTGTTVVTNGTLQLGNGSTTGSIATGVVLNGTGANLAFNRSNAYTFGNAISGTGNVQQIGSGTLNLSAANSYTGTTTVSAGTLLVDANNELGTNDAGTVVSGSGALELSNVNYSTAEALSISGTGNGSGALFNTGTSTYAGAINAAANALISAGGSGNVLNLTGGITKNGTVLTIGGGGTVNVSGVGISGSAANSDLVVDASTLNISAASTYNGPTTVQNAGTLQLGADNVLPSTTPTALTLSSTGKLDMNGHSDTVASLAGDSSGKVTNTATSGTSVLTLNSSSGTTTFAGVIEDGSGGAKVALLKSGLGAQILSGANTYTGDTTVTAGSLLISGALNSATNVTVGDATLAIGKGAGAASFETQTVASLSTGAGGFGSVIKLNLAPGSGNNDELISTGNFNLNGTVLNLILTDSAPLVAGDTYTLMSWFSGGFTDLATQLSLVGSSPDITMPELSIVGDSLVFTAPTPEPGSVVLFGVGALALVVFRRRRKLRD